MDDATASAGDQILDQLVAAHPRFTRDAFLFVLHALETAVAQLPTRRHVTGREVAFGVRDLALRLYGPMAGVVLRHWGIHRTEDIGAVVFALVAHDVLRRTEDDTEAEFVNVFDFTTTFETEYPWTLPPELRPPSPSLAAAA